MLVCSDASLSIKLCAVINVGLVVLMDDIYNAVLEKRRGDVCSVE